MSHGANVRKLYAFSFLKMALFPMAIITLFWKDQIGLSLSDILLIQAIFSLASLLLEYPSGYLADIFGYRFSLTLASLLGLAGWGVYTFADSFWSVLFAEILLGVSYAFISGSDSALLFETLQKEGCEEDYRLCEGRMAGWAQGGEAAGALFAGLLYAWAPLSPFFVQLAVWGFALLICRALDEAPRAKRGSETGHLHEALGICRYALTENHRLRSTLLLSAILGLSSFYPVWLVQPYMQETGVPLAWFGPVWAGANLSVALFSILSHRFSFSLGERGIIVLFLILVAGGYLGMGLSGGVWGFLFYYLLTAMRGLQGPHLRHHLQQESRPGTRASILSLKAFLFRLFFFLTGPAAGHLADTMGLRPTFLLLGGGLMLLLLPLAFSFWGNLPRPTSPRPHAPL